ncbi:MAG: hypothetical protein IAE94_04645 [Chthoniobacterales bacterium]|nr:hypothetical protein [Chthoniobacterales bacterium]
MTSFTTHPTAIAPPHQGVQSKRLILTAIDKGGVGKSFFCVRLIEWLREVHRSFIAFDPDFNNSTLTRFYPEAQFLNIGHSENLDLIVEALDSTDVVLVDGVGAQQRVFLDWMEETDLLKVKASLGLSVTLVLILEEDKDTVFQAGEVARRVGSQAEWLVVKNYKQSQSLRIYQNSRAREDLLRIGAREIDLQKLSEHLTTILQLNSWTIPQALASNTLNLLDRQRLVEYSRELNRQLFDIQSILLP